MNNEFRRVGNLIEAKKIVTKLEQFIIKNSMHLDQRFKMFAKAQINTDAKGGKTDEGGNTDDGQIG